MQIASVVQCMKARKRKRKPSRSGVSGPHVTSFLPIRRKTAMFSNPRHFRNHRCISPCRSRIPHPLPTKLLSKKMSERE